MPLCPEKAKEWSNITRQVNKSNEVTLPRSVGDRSGTYNLVVYSDASRDFLGSAIYLCVVNSSKSHLILTKNAMVSKNLRTKSIDSCT